MKKQPKTLLYGIFGYPLVHTLSPAMQEAAFQESGIRAFYLALELNPRQFKKTLKHCRRLPLAGFNVTVPYKETVLWYVDRLTPQAKAVGAVNTVYRKAGRCWGTNTDVDGFRAALKQEGRFNPKGKTALVIGGGGAARAVVYALSQAGIRQIVIANRTARKSEQILRDFKRIFSRVIYHAIAWQAARVIVPEADLIVNATSLGLKPGDANVLPPAGIPAAKAGRRKVFFDLIYNPAVTPFLKTAKQRGHRTVNGVSMLVHQGARAWELWTGRRAPVGVMSRALQQALQQAGKSPK